MSRTRVGSNVDNELAPQCNQTSKPTEPTTRRYSREIVRGHGLQFTNIIAGVDGVLVNVAPWRGPSANLLTPGNTWYSGAFVSQMLRRPPQPATPGSKAPWIK